MKKRVFSGLMSLIGPISPIGLIGPIGLIVLIGLMGCSEKPSPEAAAMDAAQQYYESMVEGDYDAYLAGRADMEQMPASYREQLATSYKQFMTQHTEVHGAIASVKASRAINDNSLQLMQVFLLVSYADSTQEEIVVPMVEREGEWKMK